MIATSLFSLLDFLYIFVGFPSCYNHEMKPTYSALLSGLMILLILGFAGHLN
jgi:hypothetical protein